MLCGFWRKYLNPHSTDFVAPQRNHQVSAKTDIVQILAKTLEFA
jgi:hypothetical protein